MSLTLERLDELGAWLGDTGELSPEIFDVLIDYARERAAREACQELLGPGESVSLYWESGTWRAWAWEPEDEIGYYKAIADAAGPTPTAAYLALLAALRQEELR